MTFAIGRGLARGVVGFPCSFTVFPVTKNERYIQNFDGKFGVKFQIKRIAVTDTDGPVLPNAVCKQDKQGRTQVAFTPVVAGDYLVHVTYKKQPIALSPYELIVIDVEHTEGGIREMAFSGWEAEAASVISHLAEDPAQYDLVFGVGITTLMHLFNAGEEAIQRDMGNILSNLLVTEENQIRIATEGSIQLVEKILRNQYWLHNDRICVFVGRLVSFALETNSSFRMRFLAGVGVEPLLSLAYRSCTESARYAVKSLFVISAHSDNIETLLHHGLFMEAVLFLLATDDIILKRYCLHTFYNLTKSEKFVLSLTQRKINLLIQQMQTEDRRLRLDVLIILHQISSPMVTKSFIETNIYPYVYGCLSTESVIQAWDIPPDADKDTVASILSTEALDSETKLQSSLNIAALRFLNCVFDSA